MKFNEKHYIQTYGTRMGTKCAPSCAIVFMDRLEQGYLQTQALTFILRE